MQKQEWALSENEGAHSCFYSAKHVGRDDSEQVHCAKQNRACTAQKSKKFLE